MQHTITIARHGGVRDEIDADVAGDFAVHEALQADEDRGNWSVTHVPTGWNLIWTRTKRAAFAARRAVLASGLDWSWSDPTQVPADCKHIGAMIKRRYEGR